MSFDCCRFRILINSNMDVLKRRGILIRNSGTFVINSNMDVLKLARTYMHNWGDID